MRHLDEAIRLNPSLRFQARNDSDFQNLAEDPRFTEMLYPDPGADVFPAEIPSRSIDARDGLSLPARERLLPGKGAGSGLRVVAIGGGTGLSTLLKGLGIRVRSR